jgi:fatty-acyl-CoA synthase
MLTATMPESPLLIARLFEHNERYFGHKAIHSVAPDGSHQETTYAAWSDRARRLAGALDSLTSVGSVVGTFATTNPAHLEVYLAAPCSGRIVHAINTRMSDEQITYVVNHAGDTVLFVDAEFAGRMASLLPTFDAVQHVVWMNGSPREVPIPSGIAVHLHADLLAASPAEFPLLDERAAAAVTYTSGTTGNPKAVVYSHRSVYLHAMSVRSSDHLAIAESDVVLPLVPMFHANSWGLLHGSLAAGAVLVLPGPATTGAPLAELMAATRVTVTAGVPTIWHTTLPELVSRDTSSLRMIYTGGASVPPSLIEAFRQKVGTPLVVGWAMTETSASGTVGTLNADELQLPEEDQIAMRATQGRMVFGVESRIVEDSGAVAPWDGVSSGELQVRGPWVTGAYYDDPRSDASFSDDGWLRTGDVATVSPSGRVRLIDRTKDMIKSGGEWISPGVIEACLLTHPKVAEAVVIGVASLCWSERPMACVVLEESESATSTESAVKTELLQHLAAALPKWQVPDELVFLRQLPRTPVGKYSKMDLRQQFADVTVP